MIRIVMRPQKAPVVAKEGLYLVEANGVPLCTIRARNAPHAEQKLMFLFGRELPGKNISFNIEDFTNDKRQTKTVEGKEKTDAQQDALGCSGQGSGQSPASK